MQPTVIVAACKATDDIDSAKHGSVNQLKFVDSIMISMYMCISMHSSAQLRMRAQRAQCASVQCRMHHQSMIMRHAALMMHAS